jgi:hypothetical protein
VSWLLPSSPGEQIGLRFNPGLGSGGTGKTNVGGPSSSFGIWHELLPDVKAIVAKHNLKVRGGEEEDEATQQAGLNLSPRREGRRADRRGGVHSRTHAEGARLPVY